MNNKRIGFGADNTNKKNVPKPESINFKTDGKLMVMPTLKDQIDYLHAMIGNKEWSGILFYTVEKGGPDHEDIDNIIVKAHYVMPLDIGSSVYTEYDPDEAALDAFDMFKDAEEMERGTIHTHHNMSAFFSGTDTEDLLEKVADESHSYYLSLIVNIQEAYVAKIAVIAGESYTEHVVKIGEKTSTIKVPHKKKTAFTYEIDVELPPGKEMPRPFREQVEKIIEASKTPTTHHNTRTGHYQNDAWDNNTTRKSYTAAVGTAIPGVEQKEEKKESEVEKEEVVEIDFSNGNDAMMVFADILTVSNQYGSIHEVVECQDVEDLIILVEDSLEFYHGDDNKNEGRRIYLDEMKSYLISAVFDDNAVVVAADVKEAAFRILEILNSIDECKKISTQGLHSAMKSALNSLGTNAFMQLNDYKKALTAKE